jgi:hypothetical protein
MECVHKEDEDRGTMVEDARVPGDHTSQDFTELGTILTTRHLPFQGPDIDLYLQYALEVDPAKSMTELGGLISEGLSEAKLSALAEASSGAGGLPEEFESFDVEGVSPNF